MIANLLAFLAGGLAGFGACYHVLVVPLSRSASELMRGRR